MCLPATNPESRFSVAKKAPLKVSPSSLQKINLILTATIDRGLP